MVIKQKGSKHQINCRIVCQLEDEFKVYNQKNDFIISGHGKRVLAFVKAYKKIKKTAFTIHKKLPFKMANTCSLGYYKFFKRGKHLSPEEKRNP